MTGRTCTPDGCDDFEKCRRAVNGWQGELAFCENDDMPQYREKRGAIDWSQYESLLGTTTDREIATMAGCTTGMVAHQRHVRKIPIFKESLRWPDQKCACGCGNYTNRATKTDRSKDQVRGRPNRYLPHHYNPNA